MVLELVDERTGRPIPIEDDHGRPAFGQFLQSVYDPRDTGPMFDEFDSALFIRDCDRCCRAFRVDVDSEYQPALGLYRWVAD